jgi:trypsin-like peptidase
MELHASLPPDGRVISLEDSETIAIDAIETGLHAAIVPVAFRRGGADLSAEGTAFCIGTLANGEALFITAAHVVDCLVGADDIACFVGLLRATEGQSPQHDLYPFRVEHLSYSSQFCDVAMIMANVGPTAVQGLRHLRLSFSEPVVGQKCVGLGYPQTTGGFAYTLTATQGVIEEVHPARRDSSLSTFPSFLTTGNYLRSMSGGPILGADGYVIGVISSGYDHDPQSETATGYGACIGAIIEFKIGLHADDGQLHEFTTADLAVRQVISVRQDDDLSLTRDSDGVVLNWL